MKPEPYDAMIADRVVAVVRARSVADPIGLCEALAEAGIRCVEFTLTTPDALAAIEIAAASNVCIVGAGTVLDASQARAAINAGAAFVVSPALNADLIPACAAAGVLMIPGVLSPTEIHLAASQGASVVKLFPAGLGGPHYLKDLRGPFPDIAFIPSGGIDVANAPAFLDAGAVAVFAGSNVAPAAAVEDGDLDVIGSRASSFVAALSR